MDLSCTDFAHNCLKAGLHEPILLFACVKGRYCRRFTGGPPRTRSVPALIASHFVTTPLNCPLSCSRQSDTPRGLARRDLSFDSSSQKEIDRSQRLQ